MYNAKRTNIYLGIRHLVNLVMTAGVFNLWGDSEMVSSS